MKSVEFITVADLEKNAVWQYVNDDSTGEICVKPVKNVPTNNSSGKVIGSQVALASGVRAWALIGNIDATNPRLTEHFITLSIERNGEWFSLSRYHDHDFSERGPSALAKFLDMEIDDVFPITVDVRKYIQGNPASLVVRVLKEPKERLSRADIIAMAVP